MMFYYLHVNDKFYDEFNDIESCITETNKLIREGNEVLVQTREQWLVAADRWADEGDAAFHYAQEKFPKLIVEHNIAANAFLVGAEYERNKK